MGILTNRQPMTTDDSYFYRRHRRVRRKQIFKRITVALALCALAIALFIFVSPFANSSQIASTNNLLMSNEQATRDQKIEENPLIHSPQLLFNHPNPALRAALPVDIEANIEVNGLIAHAEIKQIFINPHGLNLDGKYQFPLPENAAVKHLEVKVGDKLIIGEIMEKQAAKKVFEQAKRSGRKASLVEQQRPNLFSNKIANIPPQSTVVVTLKFVMPIEYAANHFSLRLPIAMTARYQPQKNQSNEFNAKLQAKVTSRYKNNRFVMPAERQSSAYLTSAFLYPEEQMTAKGRARVTIALNAGAPVANISSPSHQIKVNLATSANENENYLVALSERQGDHLSNKQGDRQQDNRNNNLSSNTNDSSKNLSASMPANKSFELNWQIQAIDQPRVSSFTEQINNEYFTLLTFFPPQAEKKPTLARDIIFIIDTSGSMQGHSMIQAKASLHQAMTTLTDKDSFNIIAFDDDAELLFSHTQMATYEKLQEALFFIESLSADGGTEMYRPLSQALVMKTNQHQTTKAIRQIVFVTDGAVTNEFELMKLLDGARGDYRLYTVGIGAAPNGYFMKKAAQFGRGSYVFIQNTQQVQSKMAELMLKISQPAVSNIQLMFDHQIHPHLEIFPANIPDLYYGDPIQIAVKSQLPLTSVQLEGLTADDTWYHQLIIDNNQSSTGISTLWARRKIEELVDSLVIGADKEQVKQAVIATSLAHQILSPYTSFIATEKEIVESYDKNLLAKHKPAATQRQAELMVAMPQTALGWQQQMLLALVLIIFSLMLIRYKP